MIRIVSTDRINFNETIRRGMFSDMSPDARRQYLYSPDDPNITGDDHSLVMSYDEFIGWFPQWNAMYREEADEFWYKDDEGEQYLIDSIDRTVSIVDSVEPVIPVVFINCSEYPYVDAIIDGRKTFETRSRDTLGSLVGRTVLIAETGKNGKPVVKCEALIGDPVEVKSYSKFDALRHCTRVPEFSSHDWKDGTRVKYLYPLDNVEPVEPFTPPEGARHGRVWMEYTGEVTYRDYPRVCTEA